MAQLMAVLDADVLVPILTCDLLLSAFDHDLYVPAVTPHILDEIERTLQDDFAHLDQAALRRRAGQVRTVLTFHTHMDPEASAVASVNRKDRHIAAVAPAINASLVVSNDRRLRQQLQTLDPPITEMTADEFALRLLDDDLEGLNEVLDTMVTKRTRPPVTRDKLTAKLAGPLPLFAAQLHDPPNRRTRRTPQATSDSRSHGEPCDRATRSVAVLGGAIQTRQRLPMCSAPPSKLAEGSRPSPGRR